MRIIVGSDLHLLQVRQKRVDVHSTVTNSQLTRSLGRLLVPAPILDVTCDVSVRVQAGHAVGGLQKLAALFLIRSLHLTLKQHILHKGTC